MQITKLQDISSQKGYKINDQFFVAYEGNSQFDKDNKDYQSCLEFIKNGGIVLPEFTVEELLARSKNFKLMELDNFHDSIEAKYLTIKIGNLQTGIFMSQQNRTLLDEQRDLLAIRKGNGEADPTWLYQNGITLLLDLKTLTQIRLYIGKLIDDNFRAKLNNIKAINAFKTIEELEKFDIKSGYRINQILTF